MSLYTGLSASEVSSLLDLADFGNYLALGNQIALTLACALAPGDATILLSALFLKLQQVMRYISIYYSTRLEYVLLGTKVHTGFIAFAPDMPLDMLIKMRYPTVLGRFSLYGFTSRFIVNFWTPLLFFAAIVIVLALVFLAEKLTKKTDKRYQPHVIAKKIRIIVQNFTISYIYCNIGDIVMFAILEFDGASVYKELDYLSLALAIVFIMVCFGLLARHVYYIVKYQKLKKGSLSVQERRKLKQYKQDHEGVQIFSHIFKDTTITHQLFLIIFILKVALIGIFVGCLITDPQVEAILIMVLTCLVLIYTVVRRPFNKIIDFVQFLVFDVLFLVISIALVIIATLDAKNDPSLDLRKGLSEMMLFSEFIFGGVCPIFLLIKFAIAVRNWRKGKQKYKNKSRSPGLNASTNNNSTIDGLIDLENSRNMSQGQLDRPGRGRVERSEDTAYTTGAEASSPANFGRSPGRGSIRKRAVSTNRLSPGRREKDYETKERSSIEKFNRENQDNNQTLNVEDVSPTADNRRASAVRSMSLRRGNTTRSESPGRKDRKVSYADLDMSRGSRGSGQDDGEGNRERTRQWNKRTHKKIRKESRDQRETSFDNNRRKEVPKEVSFRDGKR